MTKKGHQKLVHRKFGFEGPTDIFLKWASKSLIRLCQCNTAQARRIWKSWKRT